ncbi:hypothetical protein IAU60_006328 [Kwoniella sp. DSM 27419]
MSRHSTSTDNEKMTAGSPSPTSLPLPYTTLAIRYVQYVLSVAGLIMASLALDRSLLTRPALSDETLAVAASSVPCSFVLAAVSQAKNLGSCSGPQKMGVYDNMRACRKMKGVAVIAALDCAAFGASIVAGLRA